MDEIVDSNNNTRARKYSLRPRTVPSRASVWEEGSKIGGSRKKISRTLPLSRHRRRNANARERYRMKKINEAFDALRNLVTCGDEGSEKTTKISTLRLAIRHISALTDTLRDPGVRRDPAGVSSVVDTSGGFCESSSNLVNYPETFTQPRIDSLHGDKYWSATDTFSEHTDIFALTGSSVSCDKDLVVGDFGVSPSYIKDCNFSLNCLHRLQKNSSCFESDSSSLTEISDLKTVPETQSTEGNIFSALQIDTLENCESSECLASVNSATNSPNKGLFANSPSLKCSNLFYTAHENHHNSQVHVSQFEAKTSSYPFENEEQLNPCTY